MELCSNSVLIGRDTRELFLSTHQVLRKCHVSTRWEGSHLQTRKRAHPETDNAGTLISEVQTPDCDKISHPIRAPSLCILLWQSNLMNVTTISQIYFSTPKLTRKLSAYIFNFLLGIISLISFQPHNLKMF